MTEPRQYTKEEQREMVFAHLDSVARYWASYPEKTSLEVARGMVFSFLTMMDGVSQGMPAFELIPSPHHCDRQDREEHGENWWPDYPEDLGPGVHGPVMLHDEWHAWRRSAK